MQIKTEIELSEADVNEMILDGLRAKGVPITEGSNAEINFVKSRTGSKETTCSIVLTMDTGTAFGGKTTENKPAKVEKKVDDKKGVTEPKPEKTVEKEVKKEEPKKDPLPQELEGGDDLSAFDDDETEQEDSSSSGLSNGASEEEDDEDSMFDD